MSIWTLQDSYIATLKAIGENGKNQIQEPKIDLNIDGTQTLSFTIPMYYYNEEGIKVENPKWYNTINGNLIASLRKIKVIINKQRAQEKVIEFIITKVTERHEKAELYCDVECEGLAFHELGKTGYKITLSSDDFYAKDLEWFQEDGQIEENQPHATINWWCDQFLTPYPTNGEAIDPLTWYYKVDMDWSGYSEFDGSGLTARDSSKIYEEEYISSWDFKTKTIDMGNNQSITINEKVVPSTEEAYKEKERIVDFSESNKYNLTQDLAEAFGVFCKYEYTYDDAYHIIGRTVIFYNSFLKEDPIDITYKYDTSSISRNMDGTDIVTKMYVRPVDSDINDSGWITILDVEANKSKEDYILNFDYLYSIGAIDDDAYGEIKNYEMQMREKNIALIPIQEQLTSLNVELPEAQAQQTLAANAIQLDKERLTAADDLINNLTNNTGVIEVTNENPDTAVLLQRNGDASDIYYIKITKPGVDPNSIKIYKAIDFSAATAAGRLKTDDLITSGKFEYDEFMNLIEISNLKVENITSKIVYLTYNYTPELQYERVKKTWEARLLKDTEDKSLADAKVARLEQAIADQKAAQEDLLNKKKIIMNKFERLMGAAIREGFWQPDSYNDYGDKYIESVTVELTTSDISDDMVQFEWSNKEFEGEQKLYYEIGADTQKKYYPCIRLTDDDYNVIRNIVRAANTGWERLDTLSYLYYDTSISEQRIPRNYKCMSLGSEMTLAFVKKKTGAEIIPTLLLIGAEKLSDNIINTYLSNGILGTLTVGSNHVVDVTKYLPINGDVEQSIDPVPIKWLTLDDSYEIVYPRIAINSTELKTSEDQLSVKYSGENLTNFEDYYILIDSENKKNYITLKPKTLIKYVNFPNTAQIKFTLSNAALEIYLDAIEVEKESAFPRVSYDLKVDMVREEFVTYLYNLLNRVANINDWELHFENVQGYISKVSLNLDQPWEDSLEIQNYKTKFEDLFAKIVASTEQMQKNQYTVNVASQAFDSFGNLQDDAATVKLPIELNKGKLIIDKEQGIVSVNDNGMVVFRGDGIFTANEQDENGNWIWHSAVLPQGINADSITTGQLDTNLINVYSGDNLKFQLKDDGLFAYKTVSEDSRITAAIAAEIAAAGTAEEKKAINATYEKNIDFKQYVVHNENGLFLRAEKDAWVLDANDNITNLTQAVDRVEISWDGLVLRNWAGHPTLSADPDTGNLIIEGTITANDGKIGPWSIDNDSIYYKEDGFGEAGGLYWGTQGLSLSDAVQIEIIDDPDNNQNKVFNRLIFNDPGQAEPLLSFDRDGEGNYQLRLKNVQLSEEMVNDIIANISQSVYIAASQAQLNSLTGIKEGSLGTVYQYGTSDTTFTFSNVTADTITDVNNDHKRLYPMVREIQYNDLDNTKELLYYNRWRDNGGAHVGLTCTYWNIGAYTATTNELNYSDAVAAEDTVDKTGFVRAGLGTATNRNALAIGLFELNEYHTGDPNPQTNIFLPEETSLTISFYYKAIASNGGEAPSNPSVKATMNVNVYAAAAIGADDISSNNPNCHLIGTGTITLTGSSTPTKASLNIITTQSTTYHYIYIAISNKANNSLKLIQVADYDINGDIDHDPTSSKEMLVTTASQSISTNELGLYMYLKDTDNQLKWFKLVSPTLTPTTP